jgi:hypothetical protein
MKIGGGDELVKGKSVWVLRTEWALIKIGLKPEAEETKAQTERLNLRSVRTLR